MYELMASTLTEVPSTEVIREEGATNMQHITDIIADKTQEVRPAGLL
jgi:hypothetical protein